MIIPFQAQWFVPRSAPCTIILFFFVLCSSHRRLMRIEKKWNGHKKNGRDTPHYRRNETRLAGVIKLFTTSLFGKVLEWISFQVLGAQSFCPTTVCPRIVFQTDPSSQSVSLALFPRFTSTRTESKWSHSELDNVVFITTFYVKNITIKRIIDIKSIVNERKY